jgi:nucleotide-binding universal stress UspA family protein
MLHIEHVLCPVDFSAISQRALRHAASLTTWYEANVTVLFVRTGHRVKATESDLAAFVESAIGARAARPLVVEGDAVSEIVRLAGALPADCLVMGTHGISGVKHLLLRSVTERVLREAPCPVLTVPPHIAGDSGAVSFATVVCAVDFSPSSTRALDYAASIARKAGGRLVLLHALEWFDEEIEALPADATSRRPAATEEDARQGLEELLSADALACRPELLIGRGPAHEEVLRTISKYHAGLVVLGVHGRNILDRTLFGSTTERLVRESPCLVLTVRT